MPFFFRIFPFLRWFPLTRESLRGDLVAGVTVALVLVPQSMAYAQLAGLPVVYGLYASFVPVIVASMWGSFSQLHTGPVAMLSLMSAAALIPFASPGSATFVELSIMLALMVGVLRLMLGLFRLGAIVNFLSSPVIVGFTNAAALIIGLSQLSKLIGVPFPRTDAYLADLRRVLEQVPELHWPTLGLALGAWLLIAGLRRAMPSLPGILIAVVAATVVSAAIGYEKKVTIASEQIQAPQVVAMLESYRAADQRISELTDRIGAMSRRATELADQPGRLEESAGLRAQVLVAQHELEQLKQANVERRVSLHATRLERAHTPDGNTLLFPKGEVPAAYSADGRTWRFAKLEAQQIVFSAGGAVVGDIPAGLPSFEVPTLHWSLILALLPAALVMALIGFMEATSISKAIASSTGERIDTSKELVGQGLANIAGSFFGSYTVSGSFSRSAVAARAGAKTGIFAVISALAVVLVLLFFTPYLYHLPQAVLAVIVMMAVFSLIRVSPLVHAWKVEPMGALIGVITFVSTLVMAPAIANGILVGVVLTVGYHLFRRMKPRAEIVGRKPDGSLGGVATHGLAPLSRNFVPVRFDGELTFINVAYFEDVILGARADYPEARVILVIGSGINEIDASGEETLRELATRLREAGVELMFSGLKHQVMAALERSGLVGELGREKFFASKQAALQALSADDEAAGGKAA